MINVFKGQGAIFNGQPVLEYYSLAGQSRWKYLGIELAFFFAFFCLAFLALQACWFRSTLFHLTGCFCGSSGGDLRCFFC